MKSLDIKYFVLPLHLRRYLQCFQTSPHIVDLLLCLDLLHGLQNRSKHYLSEYSHFIIYSALWKWLKKWKEQYWSCQNLMKIVSVLSGAEFNFYSLCFPPPLPKSIIPSVTVSSLCIREQRNVSVWLHNRGTKKWKKTPLNRVIIIK